MLLLSTYHRSIAFASYFAFPLFLMEGIFGGFSSRLLLLGFVEAVRVQLYFEAVRVQQIQADNFLYVCAFAQTFGNEVLLYCFVGTPYLHNFFVEPFGVVSKRFTFSLHNSFKGCDRLWLCP